MGHSWRQIRDEIVMMMRDTLPDGPIPAYSGAVRRRSATAVVLLAGAG